MTSYRATIWVAAFFCMAACGKAPIIVDPAFDPYVTRFKDEAAAYGVHPSIEFNIQFVSADSLGPRILGTCSLEGIRINKEFWNNVTDLDREELIFHELGHCALGLNHVTTLSIMYPKSLGTFWYARHRGQLLKELFTGVRDIP